MNVKAIRPSPSFGELAERRTVARCAGGQRRKIFQAARGSISKIYSLKEI